MQKKQWIVQYVYPDGYIATESFNDYNSAMNWLKEMKEKYGG